jgi:signal transduction histidine kinase
MPEKELLITIVSTILLFIACTVVIVLSVVRYMRKNYRHRQELLTTEMEVQEMTRRNLAADLHDNIGQLLSLTHVTLGSINLGDPEAANRKLQDVQQLVARSIGELRQLSRIIHGEMVLKDGLAAAIAQEAGWIERNGYYKVSFVNDTDTLEYSHADKDLFLYRLLQEALHNAVKHSGADRLGITLRYSGDNLMLRVTDNGHGFDYPDHQSDRSGGMGLANMRKRVDLLEGTLAIDSLNTGTSITIHIPYPKTGK